MSPASFNIKLAGNLQIKAAAFSPQQLVALAGVAIHSLRDRCARASNVFDAPAKPYSTKGPIYIPISGRGTITRKLSTAVQRGMVGEIVSATKTSATLRRNKTTLGGREVFTSKDLGAMKKAGVIIGKKGSNAAIRDTGRSLRFENYAAYKTALGKSGLRDLELSGRMLNAIAIVNVTPTSVTVGFTREEEHKKAQGNQARDPWFGMSPLDREKILAEAKSFLAPPTATKVA